MSTGHDGAPAESSIATENHARADHVPSYGGRDVAVLVPYYGMWDVLSTGPVLATSGQDIVFPDSQTNEYLKDTGREAPHPAGIVSEYLVNSS